MSESFSKVKLATLVREMIKAAPDLQLSTVEEQQTARFVWPLFFSFQGVNSLLSHNPTSSH